MRRDPFYRQIEQRLAGPLDPELFERCAADVLRGVWPTLVPVRGGSDSGREADAMGFVWSVGGRTGLSRNWLASAAFRSSASIRFRRSELAPHVSSR